MDQWFYSIAGVQHGPVPESEIRRLAQSGVLTPDAPVWREGMAAWGRLADAIPSLGMSGLMPTPPSPHNYDSAGAQAHELTGPVFLYIPIWRLVVLSIATLGLYDAYWIYRNWRYLKERDGLKIMPFWRGLFGVFHCHTLLKAIHGDRIASSAAAPAFDASKLATAWVALMIMGRVMGRSEVYAVNLVGLFFSLFTFLALVPVQRYVNEVNERLPVRPEFRHWSIGHWVCLGFGVVMWGLILLGMLVTVMEALGVIPAE